MYPDFEFLLESLTGTDMPAWLSIFKIFGFFVAMGFLAAAYTLSLELKRKESQGLLQPTYKEIEVGHSLTTTELIWAIVTGFLLGFKGGGMFANVQEVAPDPLGYILSTKGNLLIGIAGAVLFGFMKYREKKKQELPKPEVKKVAIHPHQRVMEILLIAAVSGMIGAKIFNAFETWEDFLADPVGNLFSSSGLTFYGGLIVATISLYIYCRKHKIPFKHLCDAVAPGLILSYGIGRLGCHFAGDGDWGIFNSAYLTDPDGTLRAATQIEFQNLVESLKSTRYYNELVSVPHVYAPAPGWLPDWMYGMNYAHNVNNVGVLIAGCTGSYCAVLPVSVFPTPLYEFTACLILFGILWVLRKRVKYALQLFGVYLIINGLERFFIEKIRVNFKYDLGFIQPTQAEIISTVLVLTGLILIFAVNKRKEKVN